MDTISAVIGGAGLTSGGIALYMRLRLDSFIVKQLNGRYPTTALFESKLQTISAKIDSLRELLEERINSLPCKTGHVCTSPQAMGQVSDLRQAMETIAEEVHNLIRNSHHRSE